MRLVVIGSGYVGLVSGVCLAAKGHDVTCVDLDRSMVESLNRGIPHIFENGLKELLESVLASGRFSATSSINEALSTADIALIAVGTPSQDGIIDLTFIKHVALELGNYIKTTKRFLAVVVKSTVIPGTTDTIVREELEKASGKSLGDFGLGMNPEFLREGNAIEDFMQPDRVVIGYEDDRTLHLLEALYAPWSCEKIRVNTRTAELIKYANNSLLATQISAINEIANLAASLGEIDVMDVVRGVHLDKRWSPIIDGTRISPGILSYLVPGCGFGGSCFPKDVQALRSQGRQMGLPMRMLEAVLEVNDSQPAQVVDAIAARLGLISGRRCLVLGLAFKPETDDVRESASLKIIETLLGRDVEVSAHDPIAAPNFKRALGILSQRVAFTANWRDALDKAEIIIVATKWPEYAELPQMHLDGKLVFDARRMFDPSHFREGTYMSIGRGSEKSYSLTSTTSSLATNGV